MLEAECLSKMVAPGTHRPGKYGADKGFGGVIQIWVTRACDKSCFNCTQGSNYAGQPGMISVAQFQDACRSLKGYPGIVGMFGGNPALHPRFEHLCAVMREEVPFERRGIWCNNPMSVEKARIMRETFNPRVSNLNVHLDREAHDKFKQGWPESMPCGLDKDSRHAPAGAVAMKDVLRKLCPDCGGPDQNAAEEEEEEEGYELCERCGGSGRIYDEARAWELISSCDINQHWSAMIGVFRGELRAWFCEVAGAQAMLHQEEPDYPDTGLDPTAMWSPTLMQAGGIHVSDSQAAEHRLLSWWELPMASFVSQVRKHCHECSVPLRGYGELAQSDEGKEQVSATHASVCVTKRRDRAVEVVTSLEQLGVGRIQKATHYLQNASK